MLKSKLFIAAALLLGGILTANATDCYYQAEVHAVGHGKIYADGNQCMPDSVFLMGEDAYQTEMSALFHIKSADGDSVEEFLYISTLPDAPEYEPAGVKFDSITDAMTYVWVDTCSWTTEEDVTYFTQCFRTNSSRVFTEDTTHGTVYVIFKIKQEVIQAACDSLDKYAASLTDEIDDNLKNIIENGKNSIRQNDDDLDAMNEAFDNAIDAINKHLGVGLSYSLASKNVNYFNGIIYNEDGLEIKLFDIMGRMISSGDGNIEMSNCPNGIYVVTDGKGGILKINHYNR